MFHRILDFFSSLKLTIVCLSIAIVLVFIGTLAQQDLDAFYAQKKYFDTLLVWWTSGDFPAWMVSAKMTWLLSWIPAGHQIPVFPGGYLLGGVLLVNLLTAHAVRFRLSWKKTGILLAHSGLILLLVGGLYTALWSRDTRMIVAQGGNANYTESLTKEFELAVIDKSDPGHDTVVSIPESFLAKKETVENPALPFIVKPLQYMPNARMSMRPPGAPSQGADKGMAVRIDAEEVAETTRPGEDNYPAVFVQLELAPSPLSMELKTVANVPLGTWLLWAAPFGENLPPQLVTVNGKTFELQLRPKRYYKPYQIHLYHLTHEIYAGTDIPKNFASQIHLSDPSHNESRDVLIYMNHPLRYQGETFYQYQTQGAKDEFSILEVVKNPSWWLPYTACLMVGLGLTFQFGMHLLNFTKRRMAA